MRADGIRCTDDRAEIVRINDIIQKDKERIKLTQIMPAMNRCYLKRQLKKDLKAIVKQLPGNVVYENKKYQLKYTFTPLSDETPE